MKAKVYDYGLNLRERVVLFHRLIHLDDSVAVKMPMIETSEI